MSEKATLTQQQALILENEVDFGESARVRDAFMKAHVRKMDAGGWEEPIFKPMNDVSIADLARALYVGYEVEQKLFKTGDFVIHSDDLIGKMVYVIKNSMPTKQKAYEFEKGGWDYADRLRHATPEEIYWLYELGRDDIGEFHAGDIIISSDFGYPYKVDAFTNIGHTLSNKDAFDAWHRGNVKGIYPADSFKPFPK